MRNGLLWMLAVALLSVSFAAPTAYAQDDEEEETSEEGEGEEAQNSEPTPTLQRGNRMEFDGRLIKGESAGSGAVFLFERAPRKLPSMVDRRTTYLGRSVGEVLGPQAAEAFGQARAAALALQRNAEAQSRQRARERKDD